MNNVLDLQQDRFEAEILKAEIPVVVDFWAPWCGPCRMMAPVLEATAEKFTGRVKFAKINTDENARTAQAYGIMAIPTLIIFRDGREIDRLVGFISPAELESKLQALSPIPAPPAL
jgi:thioredoxin 1